jgi:hypothetical protein
MAMKEEFKKLKMGYDHSLQKGLSDFNKRFAVHSKV